MKRSTEGTGASAPAPVNSSGRSSSAQASWRRWPAREVTSASAPATVAAPTEGSTTATTPTRISSGPGPSSGGQDGQRGRPERSRAPTLRTFAGRARQGLGPAGRAVPVLATAVETAQFLAAAGAPRRRDALRTAPAEGYEQVADDTGSG